MLEFDLTRKAPSSPKLYYILHKDNIERVAQSGFLYSDARRIAQGLTSANIGMETIKHRRLHQHQVSCHHGTFVGEYVPFYFCPRSIMLYIIHMKNNPELTYRGGQHPIIHLQFDMHRVIDWAAQSGLKWAYSDRNAATRLASFYCDLAHLNELHWDAIESNNFSQSVIKEGKQAEFLVYDRVPWALVETIGVIDQYRRREVASILKDKGHVPPITVRSDWYY